MAPALVLPGPAFAARPLVLKTVSAGEVWRRIYETRFPDPLGWGPGLSRFSDPTGHAFGVVYLGVSAKVAFVETILRDAADGRGGDLLLEMAEIEKRTLASLRLIADLHLVDLTDDGRLRMGVPSDVVGARDHTHALGRLHSMHTATSRTAFISPRGSTASPASRSMIAPWSSWRLSPRQGCWTAVGNSRRFWTIWR